MVEEEIKVAASAEMVMEGTNIFPLSVGRATVRSRAAFDSPDD